jgi:hypothetical protein
MAKDYYTDSKVKQLSTLEILQSAAEQLKVKDFEDFKNRFAIIANAPTAWKMREGNSIYVVQKTKNGAGLLTTYNADTIKNYINNSKVFGNAAYKSGFDIVFINFSNIRYIDVLKLIFKNKPNKNFGYGVKKRKDGGYMAQVVLGPIRSNTNG